MGLVGQDAWGSGVLAGRQSLLFLRRDLGAVGKWNLLRAEGLVRMLSSQSSFSFRDSRDPALVQSLPGQLHFSFFLSFDIVPNLPLPFLGSASPSLELGEEGPFLSLRAPSLF